MLRLVVTDDAAAQVRAASEWWYENRPAAPGLFRAELTRAFELIASHPTAGARATNTDLPGVRRVLLRRVSYFLYYRISPEPMAGEPPSGDAGPEATVEVLGLWHTSRGSDPAL